MPRILEKDDLMTLMSSDTFFTVRMDSNIEPER